MVLAMPEAYLDPRSISSVDVLLNDLKVGTIVRTPGDFNAFSFEESYRATPAYQVQERLEAAIAQAADQVFTLTTPNEFLRRYPTQQVATPSASSWGEEGYWRVWLNESNEWTVTHFALSGFWLRASRLACVPP